MKSFRRVLMVLALIASTGGCAHHAATSTATRIPDSAPERVAGLREANPETKAAAVEDRFAPAEDRARREEARAAKAARQTRVDVVEPKKKRPASN
jgi:hypothetical protein